MNVDGGQVLDVRPELRTISSIAGVSHRRAIGAINSWTIRAGQLAHLNY